MDLCKNYDLKLYHISTISVTGFNLDLSYLFYKKRKWFSKNKNVVFDENDLYIGQIIENVYARSKFEAETYLLNAISKRIRWIYLKNGSSNA